VIFHFTGSVLLFWFRERQSEFLENVDSTCLYQQKQKTDCQLLWEDGVSDFHLQMFQKLFFSFIGFFNKNFFFIKSLIFVLGSRSPEFLIYLQKNVFAHILMPSPPLLYSTGSINLPVDVNLLIGHFV